VKRLYFVLGIIIACSALLSAADTAPETAEPFGMFVPIAFYTSDTGIAGGALVQRIYPSGFNMSLAGFYTQKNQVNVFYNTSYFSPDFPWWIQYDGSGRYYPESFYGVGPETGLEDEEQYTNVGLDQDISLYRRLGQGIYAGPVLRYRLVELIEPDEGGVIDSDLIDGTEGYRLWGAGMGFGTGRDLIALSDSAAIYYEASLLYAATFQGDETEGVTAESDLRLFYDLDGILPSLKEHQLALQQITLLAGGDLPFPELPSIGGSNSMRGYAADRYRDSAAVLLQADYRFPLYRKFKGALFAGIGNVGDDIPAALSKGGVKLAGGGGLRFQAGPTPDTSFRLDFAFTGEGYGVYFTFGEAF
jgi:Omp85 superfamily domain